MSGRGVPAALGAAAILAIATHALAELPDAGAELLLFDEPTVSAASKYEERAADAPSAVTVVTRAEIQRFGYRTLAEVLRAVRGFHGSYDRSYDYIGVRGFLRPSDSNDRILLLVNGHAYNDDITQQAPVGTDFGVDLEDVERVEVVRGPGSTLYGANAIFGVVNVVTRAPVEGSEVLAETGSHLRKRGRASLGHVFESGLEVRASGSILDVDGPGRLSYPEYDRPGGRFGIARDADGDRAVKSLLTARYGGFSFQGGYREREKHIPTGAFGVDFGDRRNRTKDQRAFAEAAWEHTVRPGAVVTARTYYDGHRLEGHYLYGGITNLDRAESHWVGGELRGRLELFRGNTLTAGAELQYHPEATQENFDVPTGISYLRDERSYDNWGIYLQDKWLLLPTLDLVVGARFDRYYGRLEDVSPRAAVIWRPWTRTTAKLLYGEAFRPPNLFEQYYAVPVSTPAQLQNPLLESEQIRTYEGLVEHTLAWGARGLLAVYRYELDGLIEPTLVPGGVQFLNLDAVEAHGVEVETQIPLPHDASLQASYTFQHARSDGRRLSNSPQHLGRLGLLFPLPADFEGGAEVLVVGPRRTLAGRALDTIHDVNLTLRSPDVRGFRVAGSIYNLLDQRWGDPAGNEHRQDRIEQDGLTFRVQVTYAF